MAYLRGQDEIKAIMLKHGISYSWIATKLQTYEQKIRYYVETSKKDDDQLYMAIMMLFENHGYAVPSELKCETLIELSLNANHEIGDQLKRLNSAFAKDIKDGRWTPDERLKMRVRLEDMKEETIHRFDQLIKATYGDE